MTSVDSWHFEIFASWTVQLDASRSNPGLDKEAAEMTRVALGKPDRDTSDEPVLALISFDEKRDGIDFTRPSPSSGPCLLER